MKKGFCGTDKSAFEFLWDILKEESQHPDDREEQAFNPFDNYTGEPSETFGFNLENFVNENDNDAGIFDLFDSSSFENVELFNPFFMTFEIEQQQESNTNNKFSADSTGTEENKNIYFGAPEDNKQNSSFFRNYHEEEEGSDSEEGPIDSLANKLHEFQSSLNHFHRKLENNMYSGGACLSPNSKKIYKPEKSTPSYFQKRNHLYNPMPQQYTFIN